jgi:hypothetical protein
MAALPVNCYGIPTVEVCGGRASHPAYLGDQAGGRALAVILIPVLLLLMLACVLVSVIVAVKAARNAASPACYW